MPKHIWNTPVYEIFPQLLLVRSLTSGFLASDVTMEVRRVALSKVYTWFSSTPRGSSISLYTNVLGTICAISDIAVFNVPGRMLDVARRDVYVTDPSEQRIKIVLWGDGAYQFNGNTVKFLGQTESAVVVFVGTTVRDCDGFVACTLSQDPLFAVCSRLGCRSTPPPTPAC